MTKKLYYIIQRKLQKHEIIILTQNRLQRRPGDVGGDASTIIQLDDVSNT